MSPRELTLADFDAENPTRLSRRWAKGKISIVKFYLPKCGWCVRSQPDYEKLAAIAGNDFNICQVNCQEVDIADKINNSNIFGFNVTGYPTYVIFVNQEYKRLYDGDRSTFSLLNELVLEQSIMLKRQ